MRRSAARLFRFVGVLCLAGAISGVACADTIYLKNGRKIVALNVTQEKGRVTYETPAGQLSLPSSIVEKVERDSASPDSVAGLPGDRAANLPIAPPNAL